jgi:hypothetical protein
MTRKTEEGGRGGGAMGTANFSECGFSFKDGLLPFNLP